MKTRLRWFQSAWPVCLLMLSVFLVSGCGGGGDGPDLAPVSGTVTLDGEPLANAKVTFTPKQPGSPSAAITDDQGKYTLRYSRSKDGAMIGTHRVEITTGDPDAEDDEGNSQPIPERVPKQYNEESTLTEEVKSGPNTINFTLNSSESDPESDPESD